MIRPGSRPVAGSIERRCSSGDCPDIRERIPTSSVRCVDPTCATDSEEHIFVVQLTGCTAEWWIVRLGTADVDGRSWRYAKTHTLDDRTRVPRGFHRVGVDGRGGRIVLDGADRFPRPRGEPIRQRAADDDDHGTDRQHHARPR